jgi:asparagine synthase (glutamine-hydrolysing)
MCGIAGIVDLAARRRVPAGVVPAMAEAIIHRGPDEDGFLEQPGLALVSRRLSIVGLADGRQPITNEDGSVVVVFNGELFDYPEARAELEKRGHVFRTHCDTELIPHLWEDYQEGMFSYLRGQFALALWDQRHERLILARDRFGVCPLYWTRQGDWLLFASEVKALLASGLVPARPDRRGIDHIFTFFALPGPVTCFEGVQSLLPGHYLQVQPGRPDGRPAAARPVRDRVYWEVDFPDEGDEESGQDPQYLSEEFEGVLLRAVKRRLLADVPVVAYLSGGVDSSTVVALASHLRREPIPTFTIRIKAPGFDETARAALTAGHVGTKPVVVDCGPAEMLGAYPELIRAAEGPVVEPATAALLLLARTVHAHGYKVALTGEGADEWLAGYPWYKVHKLINLLDVVPGLPLSQWGRRAYLWLTGAPRRSWALIRRHQRALGGHNAWLDLYSMMGMARLRFYGRAMHEALGDCCPYEDLELNAPRMRRWHPLHRALYVGARVMLPGLLLHARGDRVAMHSSVETRYPFLDEEVFAFLARLHPSWKLHGFRDKHLLRLVAERWLPPAIARRPKAIFRAPFNSFHLEVSSPLADQLLSAESLRKTGYFDPAAVQSWRQAFTGVRLRRMQRMSVEMGLAGVLTTQLWHHTFIDGSLADLPSLAPAGRPGAAA